MSSLELPVRRSRRIPPKLRQQVWETYMKNPKAVTGPCLVCETEIHILNFECGHVHSHATGGEISLENLRPICGSCNKSMGAQNLFEYKATFFNKKKVTVKDLITNLEILKIEDLPPVPPPSDLVLVNTGCIHILLKGPRRGEKCGRKIYKDSYCSNHVSN